MTYIVQQSLLYLTIFPVIIITVGHNLEERRKRPDRRKSKQVSQNENIRFEIPSVLSRVDHHRRLGRYR